MNVRLVTRSRLWIAVVGIVAIGAAALGAGAWSGRLASSHAAASPSSAATTSLAPVVQQTLTSTLAVGGTLGYSGAYIVLNEAQGHYTTLPSMSQVISDGGTLYSVDGEPVILFYGSVPAYRAMQQGESGADVAQLNADLVALGIATSAQVNPGSRYFNWWTRYSVQRLQARLGLAQTGSLDLGSIVFLPAAIRITLVQPVLGSPAQAGQAVATATSTARRVVVQLDAAQQSSVKVGDSVSITLPNKQSTAGTVTVVGSVATTPPGGNGAGSVPTVEVDITPTDAAATGTLDAAPVEVYITTASVANALAVPVTALLAFAGGGYDVEVVDASGRHHMIAVTLGLFDDAAGLVQVTGKGLAAGDMVVVAET